MSAEPRPTVFIVDDDDAVRRLIHSFIESVGFDVESYSSARAFLDAFDGSRPGCIVTDVFMPDMTGIDLQAALAARGIRMPVIVITGHADVPLAVRAMKANAVDVLEKPFRKHELLEQIHCAIRVDHECRRQDAARETHCERLAALTTREREVLELIAHGFANKQIAHALDLGEKTIETHRSKVMKKLGVRSVAELVRLAVAAESRSPAP